MISPAEMVPLVGAYRIEVLAGLMLMTGDKPFEEAGIKPVPLHPIVRCQSSSVSHSHATLSRAHQDNGFGLMKDC